MKITKVITEIGDVIINIDNEDGTFISMPKAIYDEMQTKQEAIN